MVAERVDQFVDFYFDPKVEPMPDEMDRIDPAEIKRLYPWAIEWAFDLEYLKGNPPNDELKAPNYGPLYWLDSSEVNTFGEAGKDNYHPGAFKVITWNPDSPTQGVVLTSIDLARVQKRNGYPVVIRFDEDRRTKMLAERAWFLGHWNNREHGEYLYNLQKALDEKKPKEEGRQSLITLFGRHEQEDEIEQAANTPYPVRTHEAYKKFKPKRNFAVDALRRNLFDRASKDRGEMWVENPSFENFTYFKLFADSPDNSRSFLLNKGIYTRLGKYMRSPLALGPMYDASGSVDAVVTAAMSGMLATIPRNGFFADTDRQYALAKAVMEKIEKTKPPTHKYGEFLKSTWKRNVSVALGIEDPEKVVELAQKYVDLGITHFKIFTISSNTKIVDTCRNLRKRFGHSIEIFAGQIADKTESLKLLLDEDEDELFDHFVEKEEAEQLLDPDIAVDGLALGHGGGRQCTSAAGGMAIATVQLLDNLRSDKRFQNTTIMVEGGVSDNPGIALLMGADGAYYFQRVEGAVGEGPCGDLMIIRKDNDVEAIPYRGEASVPTSIIEAALNPKLFRKHFNPAGDANQTEGKWGTTDFHRKASSATHNTYLHLRLIAKMLADIGAKNLGEMRKILSNRWVELLTVPTTETKSQSVAYGNSR